MERYTWRAVVLALLIGILFGAGLMDGLWSYSAWEVAELSQSNAGVEEAEAFAAAIRRGDIETAYLLTTAEFQVVVSLDKFSAFCMNYSASLRPELHLPSNADVKAPRRSRYIQVEDPRTGGRDFELVVVPTWNGWRIGAVTAWSNLAVDPPPLQAPHQDRD